MTRRARGNGFLSAIIDFFVRMLDLRAPTDVLVNTGWIIHLCLKSKACLEGPAVNPSSRTFADFQLRLLKRWRQRRIKRWHGSKPDEYLEGKQPSQNPNANVVDEL